MKIKSIFWEILFEDSNKDNITIRKAVREWTNLEWANFRTYVLEWTNFKWANLRSADFRNSILEWVSFIWADLRWVKFFWAKLKLVNFKWADLRWADFEWADFRWVSFEWADLGWVDFRCSNLEWVNFKWAGLRWVNFEWANLEWVFGIEDSERANQCRQNIIYILLNLKSEVKWLRKKILKWKINGSQYEWECCCLIGSLWNDNACNIIPYYTKWLHNLWEQLFYQIKEWDTPKNNIFSKIALECCDYVLSIN